MEGAAVASPSIYSFFCLAQFIMAYPHSYITRFFGMHRIKLPHLRKKVHFVVMQVQYAGRSCRAHLS